MYDYAIKVDPTYKEAEFNLGLLMYKYSSSLNFPDSLTNVKNNSQDASWVLNLIIT